MSRTGEEYFPLGLVCAGAAAHLKLPGMLLWVTALVLAAVFLLLLRHRRFGLLSRVCLALALALVLAAGFVQARQNYLRVRAFPLPLNDYIDVSGRLAAYPTVEQRDSILLLDVSRVSFHRRSLRVTFRLRLRVPGNHRRLVRGDRLRISARVRPADLYYMSRGIHFVGRSKSALQVQRIARGPLVWRILGRWRRVLRSRLEERFNDGSGAISDRGALLEALLLGDRGRVSSSLQEAMLDAGVFHLMAISGAHVGILALVVLGGLSLLGVRAPLQLALAAVALLGYLAITDFPVSAVRAGVMAWMVFLGKAWHHPANALRCLSFAGLLIFAVSPLCCLSPGFVLTFALAAAILLGRGLAKRLPRFLPRAVREGVSAGLNAGCISIPLTLLFFQRFSLIGPLAGMLLLPLCVPVMALALPMMACCLVLPFLVAWLLQGLDLLLEVFFAGINAAARLGTSIFRPAPALAVTLLTALLFLVAHHASRSWLRRAAAVLLLAVLFMQVRPHAVYRPQRLEVFFVDVGQGDCTCVVFPGGDALLIDGGGSRYSDFSVGRRIVLPFLLRQRIRVRWVAVSHFHPDHAAGIVDLIPLLRPDEVWISSAPRGHPLWHRLAKAANGVSRIRRVLAGTVLETAGCRVTCLFPHKLSRAP
ncbi:MAG TPA: DUF4131 domain-containing protein, partial [Candidatus Aminicenantes bacterium]|nr:DUF4131 domain-containing protein [Candidatus Aminicenantes bacterium]